MKGLDKPMTPIQIKLHFINVYIVIVLVVMIMYNLH
jgi:hypothetical protein